MKHSKSGRKLGMSGSRRKAMYRNMADSLIISGKIKTTLEKAKEIRVLADRLITLAKDGTLNAKRRALTVLRTKDAFKKLFTDYADRFKERNGGYTRIIKADSRVGDNAQMAYIEYLDNEGSDASTKKKRRRRRSTTTKKEASDVKTASNTENKKEELKVTKNKETKKEQVKENE